MKKVIDKIIKDKYKQGFITKVKSETFKPGLSEDVIRELSYIKEEPQGGLVRASMDEH